MKMHVLFWFLSILFINGTYSQNPSQQDCAYWLRDNTNYNGSWKKSYFTTIYEIAPGDFNQAKFTWRHSSNRSTWVNEHTFNWRNIEKVEVTIAYEKKQRLHIVMAEFFSRNSQGLITRKEIASGSAIVGKNVMNGSISKNYYAVRFAVAGYPDVTGANNAADKFRKICNRIIALSAGKNSRIDDSFFDDGD
jgi:hypothetical protein